MSIIMKKPKTKWEKRKENLVNTWEVFKTSKAGLVGIAILVFFILMALLWTY